MIKLKDLLSERTYVSNVKKVGKLQKWTIKKGGKKVDVLGSKKFFDDGRGFSTNDPDDALELWNLGKKFKGKQVPDVYGEGKLTEGKFEMKGKYLYMPDGSMSSIPGDRDREDIVFSIGQKTFRLSSFGPGGKKMYIRGDYDKQFKNVNDLVKWLNKNKAKYIGLDN